MNLRNGTSRISPCAARLAAALLVCLALPFAPASAQIGPYKDQLFSYPALLSSKDNGAYRVFDYQEMRDINGRDAVPEKRVRPEYVDMAGRRATKARNLPGGGNYYVAGREEGASVITVFIHGAGGTGKLGINDITFGGNFNRIKMLMLKNGGLYVSPDAGKFGEGSASRIGDLILALAAKSPRAPVVLACGSGGGDICHRLANHEAVANRLSGIAFLGSYPEASFKGSFAAKRRLPVYIAHGSRDPVFPLPLMDGFYAGLRAANVPVHMVVFETGSHGTPIRMVDWRDLLNYMLK